MENQTQEIVGCRVEGVIRRSDGWVVYSAVQTALERPVALLVAGPGIPAAAASAMLSKARKAALASISGIAQVYEFNVSGGESHVIYERIEGESISGRIKQDGCLSEREAISVGVALARILSAWWEATGTSFGTLSPDTILLNSRSEPRISVPVAAAPPLLPHHIPPEILNGDLEIDFRSDIYSLGTLVHLIAAGRPPFDGHSAAEIAKAHMIQAPTPLSESVHGISGRFSTIVSSMLSKDPRERPASWADVITGFESAKTRTVSKVEPAKLKRKIKFPFPTPRVGGSSMSPWQRRVAAASSLAAMLVMTGMAIVILDNRKQIQERWFPTTENSKPKATPPAESAEKSSELLLSAKSVDMEPFRQKPHVQPASPSQPQESSQEPTKPAVTTPPQQTTKTVQTPTVSSAAQPQQTIKTVQTPTVSTPAPRTQTTPPVESPVKPVQTPASDAAAKAQELTKFLEDIEKVKVEMRRRFIQLGKERRYADAMRQIDVSSEKAAKLGAAFAAEQKKLLAWLDAWKTAFRKAESFWKNLSDSDKLLANAMVSVEAPKGSKEKWVKRQILKISDGDVLFKAVNAEKPLTVPLSTLNMKDQQTLVEQLLKALPHLSSETYFFHLTSGETEKAAATPNTPRSSFDWGDEARRVKELLAESSN